MTETIALEKTRPILVLESRRKALTDWLAEGQAEITKAEGEIRKHKEQALEMMAEIDEIEIALNTLYAAQKSGEPDGG